MSDFKVAYADADKEDLVHMKAGHLVKISFGNDRVRTEPWMISGASVMRMYTTWLSKCPRAMRR